MHFPVTGIHSLPADAHAILLLFYSLSAVTGESDRSSISNIDQGKAVIPFCDICVVQWYRPFLLNICLGWFRVSVFYFGLANRLSGLPKSESVSALGFLFEFPSSLAHLYNTIFSPTCQAFLIIFLQKICTSHSFQSSISSATQSKRTSDESHT